jgi:hypothetical protein
MSDETKQTNGDSINVALVKAMGSPTGEFNPGIEYLSQSERRRS